MAFTIQNGLCQMYYILNNRQSRVKNNFTTIVSSVADVQVKYQVWIETWVGANQKIQTTVAGMDHRWRSAHANPKIKKKDNSEAIRLGNRSDI